MNPKYNQVASDKKELLNLIKSKLGNNYILVDLNEQMSKALDSQKLKDEADRDFFGKAKNKLKQCALENRKWAFISGYQEF